MFELTVGYIIGMISGYIVFRSSVVQAHKELIEYLDSYREEFLG